MLEFAPNKDAVEGIGVLVIGMAECEVGHFSAVNVRFRVNKTELDECIKEAAKLRNRICH